MKLFQTKAFAFNAHANCNKPKISFGNSLNYKANTGVLNYSPARSFNSFNKQWDLPSSLSKQVPPLLFTTFKSEIKLPTLPLTIELPPIYSILNIPLPKIPTVTPPSVKTILPLTNINGIAESIVYQADSTLRKRKKKMRRHKLKKLRKKQKFERRKLR